MQAKLFTAATVQMRPTIVLYRIIGNPLPPRHSPEDTINELKFILEYEPDYEGIEKRWLLNRVFDHSLARDIRDLIRSAGYRLDVIPFSKKEYKSVWEDLEGIPPELHPWQQSFQTEELITQAKVLDYIGRKKNQYIMNNNGARNHAIDLGLADSSWVMPWDSGCFLPEASYEVLHDLMASLGCDVISVPMSRLFGNNALALDRSYVPVDVTEPQLCFSHRTTIRFDERLRYGSCPKAMLLRQLGIPGPWQKWTCIPYWESYAGSEKSNMSGKYVQAGWVYRLTSSSWKDDPKSEATLHHARYKGIVEFIFKVDTSLIESELTYGISLLQSSCANSRDAEVRYDNSHESSCANDNIARDTLCTLAKIAASHQLSDSEVNRLLQDTLLDHDYTSVASVSDSLESLGRGIIRMPATLLARQSFPTSTMILYILVHAFHRNKLSACNKYINDLVGAMFGQSGDGSSPSLRFLSEYGTKKHITDSELARLLFLVPLLESLKIANNAWLAPPSVVLRTNEVLKKILVNLCHNSETIISRNRGGHPLSIYHCIILTLGIYLNKPKYVSLSLNNLPAVAMDQVSSLCPDRGSDINIIFNSLASWAVIAICAQKCGKDLSAYLKSSFGSASIFYSQIGLHTVVETVGLGPALSLLDILYQAVGDPYRDSSLTTIDEGRRKTQRCMNHLFNTPIISQESRLLLLFVQLTLCN